MLAGELYPEEIFTNSGFTGREQSARAKRLIVEWLQKLLDFGYNEWNSPCYIPVDMLSYVSLLVLCRDEEVKELAGRALDYTYEIFAENSFHGLLAGACGRIYTKELLANKNLETNPLMWLAWGGRLSERPCGSSYFPGAFQLSAAGKAGRGGMLE